MFSSSLSRVIRSGPSHSLSSSITSRVSTNPIAALPIPILCRTHQRRHSSSKPSSPPDGGPRGLDAPAEGPTNKAAPASKQDNEKRPSTRLGRRKSKDVATETVGKAKDDTILNLPSVPSTQHLHPHGTASLVVSVRRVSMLMLRRYPGRLLLLYPPPHIRYCFCTSQLNFLRILDHLHSTIKVKSTTCRCHLHTVLRRQYA